MQIFLMFFAVEMSEKNYILKEILAMSEFLPFLVISIGGLCWLRAGYFPWFKLEKIGRYFWEYKFY